MPRAAVLALLPGISHGSYAEVRCACEVFASEVPCNLLHGEFSSPMTCVHRLESVSKSIKS